MAATRGLPQHSCGCTAGLVSMLAAATWYVVTGIASDAAPVHRIGLGAAVALGAAVVGKLAGMAWSRLRTGPWSGS